MKVAWFSTGVSSFCACYLAKDIDQIIYTHVPNQHPDSLRFLHDCEELLGRSKIIQSDRYKDIYDVMEYNRYINGPGGAPCTKHMKREVRRKWEREHPDHHIYVWGFDVTEQKRADRIVQTMSDYEHEFPLIDLGMTKEDCHGFAAKLGLKRPVMYDMGYNNNNCVGCVRGGMGYWNKIRVDFPEVFDRMAKLEREIGHSVLRGKFLDELDPKAGRMQHEIMEDCGIACELAFNQVFSEEEVNSD